MYIDMDTYQSACERAGPSVEPVTLMEAIHQVYEMWIADKTSGKKVVFHSYFGLTLLELGIDTLFEAEQYRKALGKYFNPRALAKLAQLRQVRESIPRNRVERALRSRVRIRINDAVSIEFKAIKSHGVLKWSHVIEDFKILHLSEGYVNDAEAHRARKQALQVMNYVRARNARKKEG